MEYKVNDWCSLVEGLWRESVIVNINLPVSQEQEISLPADLQVYSHIYFVNSTEYSC